MDNNVFDRIDLYIEECERKFRQALIDDWEQKIRECVDKQDNA